MRLQPFTKKTIGRCQIDTSTADVLHRTDFVPKLSCIEIALRRDPFVASMERRKD